MTLEEITRCYRTLDKIENLVIRIRARRKPLAFSLNSSGEQFNDEFSDELVVKWLEVADSSKIPPKPDTVPSGISIFTCYEQKDDPHMNLQGYGIQRALETPSHIKFGDMMDNLTGNYHSEEYIGVPKREIDRWKPENTKGHFRAMHIMGKFPRFYILILVIKLLMV